MLYGNGVAKRKRFNGMALSPRLFSGALNYVTIATNTNNDDDDNDDAGDASIVMTAPTLDPTIQRVDSESLNGNNHSNNNTSGSFHL
jgi:hypothetical protein